MWAKTDGPGRMQTIQYTTCRSLRIHRASQPWNRWDNVWQTVGF